MAEELRKKRENVAEYLTKMVDYTKQNEIGKAKESYDSAVSCLDDDKSKQELYDIEDHVGYKPFTGDIAKGASKALKSYTNYINRKIKRLEKLQEEAERAGKKFEKVREKLEK